MELVTVGTGTVAPSARRTAACHWVQRGDLRILLDCGAGALHRLAEFGLPWHQGAHVFLTHFHPHPRGGLPMLVDALKYTTQPPPPGPAAPPPVTGSSAATCAFCSTVEPARCTGSRSSGCPGIRCHMLS